MKIEGIGEVVLREMIMIT